jgi:hypothetical protein
MEAFDTIASYSPAAARELRRAAEEAGAGLVTGRPVLSYDAFFSCVPRSHLAFLEALAPYHRTNEAIYVHGGLDPRIGTLDRQPVGAFVWGTDNFLDSYRGDEMVIYGHWDNAVVDAEGWPWPRVGDRTIGIDTISHGVRTALRLPDGAIFRAAGTQSGESSSNMSCTRRPLALCQSVCW